MPKKHINRDKLSKSAWQKKCLGTSFPGSHIFHTPDDLTAFAILAMFWKEILFGGYCLLYSSANVQTKDDVDDEGVEDDDHMIPGNVDLNESEKAF